MRVLGYHVSDKGAANSDNKEPGNISLIEFLLLPEPDTVRVLYDLGYSAGHVFQSLKLTPRETGILLDTTRFRLPPYHLRYVTSKFISIKKGSLFSYYSNASQYIRHSNSELALQPYTLACLAQKAGEEVIGILKELGIEVDSLTSPARAYEKSQVEALYKELQKSTSEVRRNIIDKIGLEIFGRTWEIHATKR